MLPELAKRHGSRRFEERLGEGYIRLGAPTGPEYYFTRPLASPYPSSQNRERARRMNQLLYRHVAILAG